MAVLIHGCELPVVRRYFKAITWHKERLCQIDLLRWVMFAQNSKSNICRAADVHFLNKYFTVVSIALLKRMHSYEIGKI